MKVILRSDISNLGKAGDLVTVANGYARNFLLPKGMVLRATKGNENAFKDLKKSLIRKEQKKINFFTNIADSLEKLFLRFPCKVGENNQMFGSVTALDIEKILRKKDFDVTKKQIKIEESLNQLGEYSVGIRLHPQVLANLKIELFKE